MPVFPLFFSSVPPTLREASTEDARLLAGLHATGFERGWSEDEFERLLSGRNSLAHAAIGPGGPTDVVGAILSRHAAAEAEILTVVVRPAERGTRVGTLMLRHHLNRLAELGVREVFLEVAEDNAVACRLYTSAGFVEVGRRAAYYLRPGESATALVLSRKID